MVETAKSTDLGQLTPAALHLLECADGQLRHSTGIRALGALKALAQIAPDRLDKPGFREKLDAASEGARLAVRECAAFFDTRLPSNGTAGEVFSAERQAVTEALETLPATALADVAPSVEKILDALSGITAAIQSQRRSLREFIESKEPLLGGMCEADHVQFVTRDAAEEDTAIFMDPMLLATALTELVNNSLKYAFGDRKGTVTLEVSRGGQNEVTLALSDDGRGIPDSIRKRMFERGATTGGSGYGLSLVKQIVEQEHLGRISYVTGPSGTRWEIALPIRISRERLQAMAGGTPIGELPEVKPRFGLRFKVPAKTVAVGLIAVAAAALAFELFTMMPGRVPEGLSRVPWAGRDFRTGWAREAQSDAAGVVLAFVPAGEFTMGADSGDASEGPAHKVTITRPFYIGESEVTQGQYAKVMGDNPSRKKGDDLPVETVSYVDCAVFCQKTNLTMPTEAQWEYAVKTLGANAGDGASRAAVSPADLKVSSRGLSGILGGVSEWCSDWYRLYEAADATDPQGPAQGTGRVVRGGSYIGDPAQATVTMRSPLAPTEKRDYVGFRVALDTPAK